MVAMVFVSRAITTQLGSFLAISYISSCARPMLMAFRSRFSKILMREGGLRYPFSLSNQQAKCINFAYQISTKLGRLVPSRKLLNHAYFWCVKFVWLRRY